MEIRADEVHEGHFLPGLDNGYVVNVESAENKVSLNDGNYSFDAGFDSTLITFHDRCGEECYLVVPNGMLLTVEK